MFPKRTLSAASAAPASAAPSAPTAHMLNWRQVPLEVIEQMCIHERISAAALIGFGDMWRSNPDRCVALCEMLFRRNLEEVNVWWRTLTGASRSNNSTRFVELRAKIVSNDTFGGAAALLYLQRAYALSLGMLRAQACTSVSSTLTDVLYTVVMCWPEQAQADAEDLELQAQNPRYSETLNSCLAKHFVNEPDRASVFHRKRASCMIRSILHEQMSRASLNSLHMQIFNCLFEFFRQRGSDADAQLIQTDLDAVDKTRAIRGYKYEEMISRALQKTRNLPLTPPGPISGPLHLYLLDVHQFLRGNGAAAAAAVGATVPGGSMHFLPLRIPPTTHPLYLYPPPSESYRQQLLPSHVAAAAGSSSAGGPTESTFVASPLSASVRSSGAASVVSAATVVGAAPDVSAAAASSSAGPTESAFVASPLSASVRSSGAASVFSAATVVGAAPDVSAAAVGATVSAVVMHLGRPTHANSLLPGQWRHHPYATSARRPR